MKDSWVQAQEEAQRGFDSLGCCPVTQQEHRDCWDHGCKDREEQVPGHIALDSWFFLGAADCSISPITPKKEKYQKYKLKNSAWALSTKRLFKPWNIPSWKEPFFPWHSANESWISENYHICRKEKFSSCLLHQSVQYVISGLHILWVG